MEEKKQEVVNCLVEKGLEAGTLNMNDIEAAIADLDLKLDELIKLYETIEDNNIEIVDDLCNMVCEPPKKLGEMSGKEITKALATFDPVEDFFRDVGSIPPLTQEEEIELAIRISEGDEKAKKKLAESSLRLVGSIARRYVGRGMHFLDLVYEGSTILMLAAEKYDYTSGVRFNEYTASQITQAITRALKEHLVEDSNSERSAGSYSAVQPRSEGAAQTPPSKPLQEAEKTPD